MAKLKIGKGGIQAEINLPEMSQSDVTEQVLRDSHDSLIRLRLGEIDDKISDLNLNMIAHESEVVERLDAAELRLKQLDNALKNEAHSIYSDIKVLHEKLSKVSRPVVKEIKLDKTNAEDLDHLEANIGRTVSKLNAERSDEHRALVRMVLAGNRLQSAINFLIITGIVLLAIFK